jgi:hypothetical protein
MDTKMDTKSCLEVLLGLSSLEGQYPCFTLRLGSLVRVQVPFFVSKK